MARIWLGFLTDNRKKANRGLIPLGTPIYILEKRSMIERTKNTTVETIFEKTKIISSCNSFLSLSLSIVRKKRSKRDKILMKNNKNEYLLYGKIDCMKIFQSRCNHDYFNEICQELNICHILRDQYDTLCYLVKMINICIY